MLAPRNARSPLTYVLLVSAIVALIYYRPWSSAAGISAFGRKSAIRPANATLGFGALYVVSGPGSPRRQHLEEAAAVTELALKIPDQATWTDQDVRDFRPANEADTRVLTGSVKAWLSHHLVLREFLKSGHETAVIFEDDIDWDVRLRTQQIPLAQRAAQTLSEAPDLDTKQYPWGLPSDWDLFYVGHCGDYFGDVERGIGVGYAHPTDLATTPHVLYKDPTLLPRTDLHPFTASLLTAFNVPDQTRVVHQSKWPLCTFGYAITRHTAERILNEIAPAHEDPSRNLVAYDAAILTGCRDGPLRCYTVTPELFHHMEGESLIADMEATERQIFRPPVDAAGLEQVRYRKETSNIGCGFYDGSFYFNADQDRLAYLREQVGRQGKCLKEGR